MVRLIALWAAALAALILALVIREERLASRGKVPTGRLRRLWFGCDRRRAPRYRVDWVARYNRPPEVTNGKGRTRDVSRMGAGLIVEERLKIGSVLTMELSLPNRPQPLRLSTEVRWTKELPRHLMRNQDGPRAFWVGVQFLKMDPALESDLQRALESR